MKRRGSAGITAVLLTVAFSLAAQAAPAPAPEPEPEPAPTTEAAPVPSPSSSAPPPTSSAPPPTSSAPPPTSSAPTPASAPSPSTGSSGSPWGGAAGSSPPPTKAQATDPWGGSDEEPKAEHPREKKSKTRGPQSDKPKQQPGTGLLATGGTVLGVSAVAGIAMVGVGVSRANEAEDKIKNSEPGPARRNGFDQGASANTLTLAGAIVAGVGATVGIALIATGTVKRKGGDAKKAMVSPQLLTDSGRQRATGGGLVLSGRF